MGFNCKGFASTKPDNILEAIGFIRQHAVSATSALGHLEVHQVQVNWVGPTTGAILQLPCFNSANSRPGQYSVLNVCEANIIDEPLPVGTTKLEVSSLNRSGRYNRKLSQSRRNTRRILDRGRANNESHGLISVQILIINTDVVGLWNLTNVDALPSIGREINDDLITLAGADVEIRSRDRSREEASVRGDDLER